MRAPWWASQPTFLCSGWPNLPSHVTRKGSAATETAKGLPDRAAEVSRVRCGGGIFLTFTVGYDPVEHCANLAASECSLGGLSSARVGLSRSADPLARPERVLRIPIDFQSNSGTFC